MMDAPLLVDRTVGATRTSHRWSEQPGNWDRLNCRALYPSDNGWGIPCLPLATATPARLVAYSDRSACDRAEPGDAVHFFLDDYRFEVVWNKPERGWSRCAAVGGALTPDFSLWPDMPRVMQVWQVYRSRWVGCWLASHGVDVVPTVGWSTPDSYGFAFAGIARGSVVAVSTVGATRDPKARAMFANGLAAMVDAIEPATILVYGTPPEHSPGGVPMRVYPARGGRA